MQRIRIPSIAFLNCGCFSPISMWKSLLRQEGLASCDSSLKRRPPAFSNVATHRHLLTQLERGHKGSWMGWAEVRPCPVPWGVNTVKSPQTRSGRPAHCKAGCSNCAPSQGNTKTCTWVQLEQCLSITDGRWGGENADSDTGFKEKESMMVPTFTRGAFQAIRYFKNSTMHYCQQGLQNHIEFINVPAALVINTQWFSVSLKCIIGSFFCIKNSVLQ